MKFWMSELVFGSSAKTKLEFCKTNLIIYLVIQAHQTVLGILMNEAVEQNASN